MTSREWTQMVPNAERERIAPFLAEAPVQLSAIADSLGLTVLSAALPDGISGEIRPDNERPDCYVIRVNKREPARRQRFTVAHEIGHYLIHRDQIGTGIRDDALYRSSLSDAREAQANRLAADLLMPMGLVKNWLDKAELLKVEDALSFFADKFNVSEAAMKIRLGLS